LPPNIKTPIRSLEIANSAESSKPKTIAALEPQIQAIAEPLLADAHKVFSKPIFSRGPLLRPTFVLRGYEEVLVRA
jgi:hypothetical protein